MAEFDNKDVLKNLMEQGLSFDNMNTEQFLDFIQLNTAPIEDFLSRYKCAVMEIETKFKVLNERFSIQYDKNPIESIKTRVKSIDGIARKIIRKKIDPSLESIEQNIYDIAGVRVICSFEQDVYLMADQLLKQDDITLLKKKDYISNPKPNGYRSLHLIVTVPVFTEIGRLDVPVEVQLRTIAMDFWASLEHKIRYKKDISESMRNELSERLADCAEKSNLLDKEFQKIFEKSQES